MIQQSAVRPGSSDVEALATAAADGCRTSLGSLYEQLDGQVFAYVYRRVQSRQVAEDVAADVWVRVLTSIDRYETRDGGFLAFLFTIARRLLMTRYRDASRRPDVSSDLALVHRPCPRPGPLDTTVSREVRAQVGQALQVLTPAQAAVLRLRYIEGLSEQATADRLGYTVGSVKQYAWRGKRTLRMVLTTNEARTWTGASLAAVAG